MGVGLSPTILPAAGKPTFELGPDEMEIGIGIHGERGVRRGPLESADQIAGDLRSRDGAYHQGTVWAWLIDRLFTRPIAGRTLATFRALGEALTDPHRRARLSTLMGRWAIDVRTGIPMVVAALYLSLLAVIFIGMGHWTGLSSSAYALSPFTLPAFSTLTAAEFGWAIVLAFAAAGLSQVELVEEPFELDFDEWFDRGTPLAPKAEVRARILSGRARGFDPERRADGGITLRCVRVLARGLRAN